MASVGGNFNVGSCFYELMIITSSRNGKDTTEIELATKILDCDGRCAPAGASISF